MAVNLWYDVGSKHEQPGKTGFAHLFEHMMFQGSANVAKGEHFAQVQAAGGTLNATTWLDRTNYFETLPSHELELALWLEADRMGQLLPAMTQEKLDNQRDVVKNERRWSVDNQPYGTWDEKLQALAYPDEPSVSPSDDRLHGRPVGSIARGRAPVLRHLVRPQQRGADRGRRLRTDAALAAIERQFGPIPRQCRPAAGAGHGRAAAHRRGGARDRADRVPLPRVYVVYRMPTFGTDAWDALEVAADLLASGRASRLYRTLVRERQLAQDVTVFAFPMVGGASMFALWATARPGVAQDELEAALFGEIERSKTDGPSLEELERVRNLHAAGVESGLERLAERADRLSMYTVLFDAPEMLNTEVSRYVAVDAERVRARWPTRCALDNRVVLTYLPAELAEPRPKRRPPRPSKSRRQVRRRPGRSVTVANPHRPVATAPRPYHFPEFERQSPAKRPDRLAGGAPRQRHDQRAPALRCGSGRGGRGAWRRRGAHRPAAGHRHARLDAPRSPRPPNGWASRSAANPAGTVRGRLPVTAASTSTRASACSPRWSAGRASTPASSSG